MEKLVKLSGNVIAAIYWSHRYPRPEAHYQEIHSQNPEAMVTVTGVVDNIVFYHHTTPDALKLDNAETAALMAAVNRIQANEEQWPVGDYWA